MPVTITFRTTDLGQWGVGKGANLTPGEVDQNFWNLVQAIESITLQEPNQIAAISVDGNQMTIIMEDSTEFGPFTLPTASFRFTGPWQPNHNYLANDLFTVDGGLYFVNFDHTSASDFNPNAGGMEGPYASLIMAFPTTFSVGFFFPGRPGFGIDADEYEAQAMFSYRADRAFYLPVDLEGSVGGLFIQSTSEMVLTILRNEVEIGTVTIAAASTDVTFTFDAVQQFMPGDVLRVLRPLELDATAKDLTLTFQATLGETT